MVIWKFANSINKELEEHGLVLNPKIERSSKEANKQERTLAAFSPPLSISITYLRSAYGVQVSISPSLNIFTHKLSHSGKFKKPNLIPVDQFKPGNKATYAVEFMNIACVWYFGSHSLVFP